MNKPNNPPAEAPLRKLLLIPVAVVTAGLLMALGEPLGELDQIHVAMEAYNSPKRAWSGTRGHNAVRCKNLSTTKILAGGRGLTPLNGYSLCNDAACGSETALTVEGNELWLLQPAIFDGGVYQLGSTDPDAYSTDYNHHCGGFSCTSTDAGFAAPAAGGSCNDAGVYDAGACPSFASLVDDIECIQGR